MTPYLFIKFLSKATYCPKFKTFYICNLLSLRALSNCCDPFERCISYSHDQDHVHSTYFTNFYTRSCTSIPQNKNSMLFIAILSKLKGHGPVKKGHMKVQSIQKKKKYGHMKVQYVSKKSQPMSKEIKREIAHERSSYTVHKIHTLAHPDQGL